MRKMSLFARKTVGVLAVAAVFVALATPALAQKAAKKTKLDTPVLSCGTATQKSIDVVVTAGATGAPAGFSLHWMTKADFDLYGWAGLVCGGSFSGNANESRYALGPGESVTVKVGELLFDNGASTNCDAALECGTEYVFRTFAHATSTLSRSDFSGPTSCSTLSCGHGSTCTYTQGYWKTHGPIPTGNNENEWPVTALALGTVEYTDLELLAILNTSVGGNGLLSLAHQLIAAKLNVAAGADPADAEAALEAADALIADLVVPPVGSGALPSNAVSTLVQALADYNEGLTGPGHCD